MTRLERVLTVRDAERIARAVLPKQAYDYYRSGADAERTRRENIRAFRRWEIDYRVLVDVAHRDTSVTILGDTLASPILVAPTAYHRMAHPDGEAGTARAAAKAGTLMVVSTLATTVLEEVAAASSGPKWFQLYVHKDRGFTRALVERAHAAGYKALVLTVDAPFLGRRLADERNGFALPPGLVMANLLDAVNVGRDSASAGRSIPSGPDVDRSMLARYVAARHDASITFRDLDALRSIAPMPLLVKGVVRGDDAVRALDSGADGVIVSNHGGRQLDGSPASLDALVRVRDAVGGRGLVLMDGGIRWGTDVLKAIALGARAVLVGRPVIWGLAAGGEAGVLRVLELLRGELSTAMALAGCASIADITEGLVRRAPRA